MYVRQGVDFCVLLRRLRASLPWQPLSTNVIRLKIPAYLKGADWNKMMGRWSKLGRMPRVKKNYRENLVKYCQWFIFQSLFNIRICPLTTLILLFQANPHTSFCLDISSLLLFNFLKSRQLKNLVGLMYVSLAHHPTKELFKKKFLLSIIHIQKTT